MAVFDERVNRPWPLTGRQDALDRAREALDLGQAVVVISGDPGVGKTRLATEVVRHVADAGRPVVRVVATPGLKDAPLAAIAHLLPATDSTDPVAIFQTARTMFGEHDGPVTVMVDDAHWLDSSSASVFAPLADAGVIQLVLTVRPHEPLSDAFTALCRSERCSRLDLGALDADAVDSLLAQVLGGPLDGAAKLQLLEASAGNPLLLRELLIAAVDDGSLAPIAGVWRLSGPIARNRALGERVLDRITALDALAREVIEVVAVGGAVGLDDLESQFSIDLLEDLEQRALIRVVADGLRNEVMLTHPVYGDIVRSTLGRVRLRRIAREHVQRVERHGSRRRGDRIRVAQWQLDAGMSPDPAVSLAAAYIARHALDFATTAIMARAALDAGEQSAAVLLAQSLYELGRFDELDVVVLDALGRDPDEFAFMQLTRMRAIALLWGPGDHELALSVLDHAVTVVTDTRHRELLQFARSLALAWTGRVDEALTIAEQLLTSDHTSVVVQGALTVELVAAMAGPATRAVALADQYFPVHFALAEQDEAAPPGNHLVCKSLALANAGDIEAASVLADFGYGASVTTRSQIGQMWFSLQLAQLALLRGDAQSALRWLREQVALSMAIGHRRVAKVGHSQIAIAAAYLGEIAAAREALAEMNEDPELFLQLFSGEAVRAKAWVLAAEGDVSGARSLLIEGAQTIEASGLTLMGALVRFDAVRLGDRAQSKPLAAADAVCDSKIVSLAARWSSGLNDGATLETVADEFNAMGCVLFAAEANAVAAAAWRTSGDNRRAANAERRAEELARTIPGLSAPTLVSVDSVVALTARELEIALLVAQGMASKDIAALLFLSPRTVSNHLQNAFAKLGVARRSELAEAMGRYGNHR